METFACPVGAKFQVTLPKRVRAALGIEKPGELVGFRVERGRVVMARAKIRLLSGA